MKRLILPLIAALALPPSVSAESYWLLITDSNTDAFEKIEMKDMEQCQLQGSLLKSTKEMNAKGVRIGFECVESE